MTAQTMQIGNRPCRIYGEAHAEYLLLQMTGEHELQSMDDEVAAIAQSNRKYLFAAIPAESWNDALSPWKSPAVWGKQGFGGNAGDTLRFLTEQVVPTLVGLQGLCISCADNYMADLPENVQNSRTLRDILKKDSIRQQQEKFYQRAENEKKLLLSVGHVTGRTTFDKTISLEINPSLVYHTMNETMRPQFYSGCWEIEKTVPGEIFISQGDYPLKGFHYLLQAMQEILQNCPEAHIKVAGISVLGVNGIKSRIKIPAYGKYLRRLILKNRLEGKVRVLGNLSAEEMKREYLSAQIFVCPSAVENSPNSVAEGQLLGVPVAASRTGGIPDVVKDGVSGLLFEKGNVHELAACVSRILTDKQLAKELSASERETAAKLYNGENNYQKLIEIYQSIE